MSENKIFEVRVFPHDNFPADSRLWPEVEEIEPSKELLESSVGSLKIPKDPKKAEKFYETQLEKAKKRLAEDVKRYEDLRSRGSEALSGFDRGDTDESAAGALRMALTLKKNHLYWSRGRVPLLQAMLDDLVGKERQLSLFG